MASNLEPGKEDCDMEDNVLRPRNTHRKEVIETKSFQGTEEALSSSIKYTKSVEGSDEIRTSLTTTNPAKKSPDDHTKDPLNILVLGRSPLSTSTTGNSILGNHRDGFPTDIHDTDLKKHLVRSTFSLVAGRTVQLHHVPHVTESMEKRYISVVNTAIANHRYDAVVMVLSHPVSTTGGEIESMMNMQRFASKANCRNNLLFILTVGSASQRDTISKPDYIQELSKQTQDQALIKLFRKMEEHYIVFENETDDDRQMTAQRESFFEELDKVCSIQRTASSRCSRYGFILSITVFLIVMAVIGCVVYFETYKRWPIKPKDSQVHTNVSTSTVKLP